MGSLRAGAARRRGAVQDRPVSRAQGGWQTEARSVVVVVVGGSPFGSTARRRGRRRRRGPPLSTLTRPDERVAAKSERPCRWGRGVGDPDASLLAERSAGGRGSGPGGLRACDGLGGSPGSGSQLRGAAGGGLGHGSCRSTSGRDRSGCRGRRGAGSGRRGTGRRRRCGAGCPHRRPWRLGYEGSGRAPTQEPGSSSFWEPDLPHRSTLWPWTVTGRRGRRGRGQPAARARLRLTTTLVDGPWDKPTRELRRCRPSSPHEQPTARKQPNPRLDPTRWTACRASAAAPDHTDHRHDDEGGGGKDQEGVAIRRGSSRDRAGRDRCSHPFGRLVLARR